MGAPTIITNYIYLENFDKTGKVYFKIQELYYYLKVVKRQNENSIY
jgi:hypothetical protein